MLCLFFAAGFDANSEAVTHVIRDLNLSMQTHGTFVGAEIPLAIPRVLQRFQRGHLAFTLLPANFAFCQ